MIAEFKTDTSISNAGLRGSLVIDNITAISEPPRIWKYTRIRQGLFLPVLALTAVLSLVIPHKSFGTTSSSSLEFSTHDAYRASIMYIERDSAVPYKPSRWSTYIVATSYNSVPWQTDSTPFITASGTRTRDGIIASNYLPIGTEVRFPDLYGSKIFTVEDRMNERYFKRVDIWAEDMQFSKKFGVRYLRMEVL